jgi:hypothetical protein
MTNQPDISPEGVAKMLDGLENGGWYGEDRFNSWTREAVPALAARLAEVEAEAGKMLAEADSEYNRKTNAMIARHAKALGALKHRAETAEAALAQVAALDDNAECCGHGVNDGCNPPECCGCPDYGLDRAQRIALQEKTP